MLHYLSDHAEKIGLPAGGVTILGFAAGGAPSWSIWLGGTVSVGMLVTAISREIRGWLDRRKRRGSHECLAELNSL